MPPKTDFPPIRACLFDMDGLLLNTEDLYTVAVNNCLKKYNKDPMPWSVKAQLQGRPGPEAGQILLDWAQLPVDSTQWFQEVTEQHKVLFPGAAPLPGVEELLRKLSTARPAGTNSGESVHLALATSSHKANFKLKTDHLGHVFEVFEPQRRVLGDDERIPRGKGKPAPDIYLLALQMVNETLPEGERPITPAECLVFEDSVPGVEAGRRAGMRVIWCPHPELAKEFKGREPKVLAGKTAGEEPGIEGDGWAEYRETLEDFPYEKYGIVVEGAEGK